MSGTLSPWPVVQNGNQGHPIRTLQFLLRAHDHNLTVDGMFGPATEAAVKAFQASKGMTADGIMNPQTWSVLIIQVKKGSQWFSLIGNRLRDPFECNRDSGRYLLLQCSLVNLKWKLSLNSKALPHCSDPDCVRDADFLWARPGRALASISHCFLHTRPRSSCASLTSRVSERSPMIRARWQAPL
jgi:hypothetical protein